MIKHKANRTYWAKAIAGRKIPPPFSSADRSLFNHIDLQHHEVIANALAHHETAGLRLLEIGCAASKWLPYFVKEYGFHVTGIDYSEIGCNYAARILREASCVGEIQCMDFLKPLETLTGSFDVVISFGVMEHYEPIADAISAASVYLKPGGILITQVPNLVGVNGFVQRVLDRSVYDKHHVISASDLGDAHRRSGLIVLSKHYFGSLNFGVCNLNGISSGSISWWLRKPLLFALSWFSILIWWTDRLSHRERTNKWSASYITCISRKSE